MRLYLVTHCAYMKILGDEKWMLISTVYLHINIATLSYTFVMNTGYSQLFGL